MTLEDAIYNSILSYPSLYYKKDFKDSRLAVLNHFFLTLGTGIELAYTKNLENGGYFTQEKNYKKNGDWVRKYDSPYGKEKVSQELKDKINAGVRLYEVLEVDKDTASSLYFSKRPYNRNHNYIFEDVSPIAFPLLYSKVEGEKNDFCVDVYPEDKEFNWNPYPFSLWYSSFVEINPHRNKYTWETIDQISTEELRESKNLIKADWAAGIVEIFTAALNWFESDKFDKSTYYNWSLDSHSNKSFIEKFDSAKIGDFAQFCKDYNLPVEDYPTWKDFASACSNKNRRNYISNCKKIIESFS